MNEPVDVTVTVPRPGAVGSMKMATSPVRIGPSSGNGFEPDHGNVVPEVTYSNVQVSPIDAEKMPSRTTKFWSAGVVRYVDRSNAMPLLLETPFRRKLM